MKKFLFLLYCLFLMACGSSLTPIGPDNPDVAVIARSVDVQASISDTSPGEDTFSPATDSAMDEPQQDSSLEPIDTVAVDAILDSGSVSVADSALDSQSDTGVDAVDAMRAEDASVDIASESVRPAICGSFPRPAVSFDLSVALNRTFFSAGTAAMNMDSVASTFPSASATVLNYRAGSSHFGRTSYQGYRSNTTIGNRFGENWTINSWILPTCTNDFCSVFAIRTQETGFGLMVTNGRTAPTLYFYAKTAAGWATINYTSRVDSPTMVTVTSSAIGYKLYINGVLYQETPRDIAIPPDAGAYLYLGTNYTNAHYYQGLMDDFALFSSTFTDTQVADYYNCER